MSSSVAIFFSLLSLTLPFQGRGVGVRVMRPGLPSIQQPARARASSPLADEAVRMRSLRQEIPPSGASQDAPTKDSSRGKLKARVVQEAEEAAEEEKVEEQKIPLGIFSTPCRPFASAKHL